MLSRHLFTIEKLLSRTFAPELFAVLDGISLAPYGLVPPGGRGFVSHAVGGKAGEGLVFFV